MKFQFDPAKEFKSFQKRKKTAHENFALGNQFLYDLCRKHPCHKGADEIHAKVWLIGRAYAAAIERGRINDGPSDSFYRDSVVPAFQKNRKTLDAGIAELNASHGGLRENAEEVLSLHKQLLGIIHRITKKNKRSLASKYLHFHCPDFVPIYDSRARTAARRIVNRPNVPEVWEKKFDPEYADFFARILAIAEEIKAKTGRKATPRQIDDFLLDFDARHSRRS